MGNHTTLGFIISTLCALCAHFAKWISANILHIHIPPIVMESAQLTMWITGSGVATITFHGWYIKQIKHKLKKKKIMNLTIQRFAPGHEFYTDKKVMHKGTEYQAVFGQCINSDTGEFIDYTLERLDTLIAEDTYKYAYYHSPANKCIVPLLISDSEGKDISARKLEHHIANYPWELEGCCAHGQSINTSVPMLIGSGKAFNHLMHDLAGATGTIKYETLK